MGLVNAACLAAQGHSVVGVDCSSKTVADIEMGRCPFLDPPLAQLLESVVPAGRLRATTRLEQAMGGADIVICCVGSPVDKDGEVDLSQLTVATKAIGSALSVAGSDPIIVLRSTVPPKTTSRMFIPLLESQSGLKHGKQFHVAYVPEFLREGSAVHDFEQATRAVIGTASDVAFARMTDLLAPFSHQILQTSFELAELAKLTDNAWHSLKVSFANELGNIALAAGQDGRQLLDILCLDSKLNMSPAYLHPGFAFGGPCLPKDLKMLKAFAGQIRVTTPVLHGAEEGNNAQIERARALVLRQNVDRVTLIGPQFKSGTNRLTGSPSLELIARLQDDGIRACVYTGADNLAPEQPQCRAAVAHSVTDGKFTFSRDLRRAVAFADLIIIGCVNNQDRTDLQELVRDKTVLDLTDGSGLERHCRNYIGLSNPMTTASARDLELLSI